MLCERPCRTLGGKDWNLVLPNIHEQILFVDEENKFVKSQEFATLVKASDNYFVIITREDLPNLPYSVEEIYGIHTSGKYHDLKRTYNELWHRIFPGCRGQASSLSPHSSSRRRSFTRTILSSMAAFNRYTSTPVSVRFNLWIYSHSLSSGLMV